MEPPPQPSLQERLERLEAKVDELARALGAGPPPPAAPLVRRARPPGRSRALLRRDPQYWISRAGIGLLLVGLVFLFQYAAERGWLGPWVRVACGVALGGVLAAIGWRVRTRQRAFAALMLGGAAAAWYVTDFAAFQLLSLIGQPLAYAGMVAVTLFLFATSVREAQPALAVLGVLGGLSTPFALYTGEGSVAGLAGYTAIVLAGAGAIHLLRGWRTLLATSAIGGALVLWLAGRQRMDEHDRLVLQGALVVAWLCWWLVPLRRARLDAALLAAPAALVALVLSRPLWTAGDTVWGSVALALGALYACVAQALRGGGAAGHRVAAAVLVAVGAALLFEARTLFWVWALQAALLHALAARLRERALAFAAHALFLVVALWFIARLAPVPERAFWNARALADAAALLAIGTTSLFLRGRPALAYRLTAHCGVLAWSARELTALSLGSGLVTAVWGGYGLALLVLAPGRARAVGLATLLLAAAKLVVVDARQLEPLWRILLFLAFGAALLAVGYWFRRLWRRPDAG
jgi:uncharacterized membrane protein